ncbi:arsenate reductase family protein [Paenibacillus lemnae]|uniref:Arsenate reductase family protein n=1 Tax=Paenibacillus lemnae TaxID=1330551 RepID=A0A848M7J4_PAELE|nr:arsenate reductase family protein [Paenibacillus lemnae]NMO96052.1 arsenate reductase family protein [Paenibacillus lemnae]
MSQLQVYHYPACGTCKKAVKWLQQEGHDLTLRHIKEEPPTPAELSDLIAKSGLDIKKFFNTSGEVYKQMNLKDKLGDMTEDEKIQLLSSNGMLIKRPVVTDGSSVTVGFKEDVFAENWKA